MSRVWVNGTFDVMHIGHVRLLKYAASLGELRVGIDTDERVKRLKGNTRPFNNLEDRMEFISSLKFVNEVVTYTTDEDLEDRIKTYDPDVMVKGSDWKGGRILGQEYVNEVIYFDLIKDKSTSKILSYYK
jgi:D-beta-D-heptose 7-phosphate kinase/D-beta-D-heptose 1-phosphate adenosyltransferase